MCLEQNLILPKILLYKNTYLPYINLNDTYPVLSSPYTMDFIVTSHKRCVGEMVNKVYKAF